MMPSNDFLIGKVGVMVVLVGGGNQGPISGPLREKALSQIEKCLDSLKDAEPRAKLVFVVESIYIDAVSASQVSDNDTDESESPWRNEVMQQLGYESYERYLESRLSAWQCVSGFLVFVTNQDLPHFAYSANNKITLSINPSPYGVEMLHALLAHEICHVFGAEDEVGNCHCEKKHGFLEAEHGNCYLCNPNPLPCVMAGNSRDICPSTRKQIGWHESLFKLVGN